MDTYSPYNAHNRYLTEADIHAILRKHGLPHYRVTNRKVFQTAMIHTTYVRRAEYTTPDGRPAALAPCPANVMPLQDESYECLEFEGDSVLGVCVATYLRHTYPEKKQGFLTDARKELVNNERIGFLSKKIGLDRFYVISRHNEEAAGISGRHNLKKLGDIFEAFIGALWTDCGGCAACGGKWVPAALPSPLTTCRERPAPRRTCGSGPTADRTPWRPWPT
jgi:dsRNA-specific ribonuclease